MAPDHKVSMCPPLKTYSSQSVGNSIIAGYTAGVCGVVIGHPMDSLKVWFQTDNQIKVNSNTTTKGTIPKATTFQRTMSTLVERPIPRVINLRTLYAGVGGPLVTVGMIQSANFGLYDSLRRIMHRRDHPQAADKDYLRQDSIVNVAVSSMIAGSLLSFITSPLIVIKTKQQVMTWDFRTALAHTAKGRVGKPVISNFYVGFGPHFLSETVGRGIYFSCYETLKRWMAKDQETASLAQRMFAAAMSGITCWSIIFPLDVLRNRMSAQAIRVDVSSAWDMTKALYLQEGWRPFYRGFGVTVLRAGPVAAAVLPVYDVALEWLNNK